DASVLDDAAKILGATAKEGLAYLRDLAGLLDCEGIRRSDYAFDMGVVRGLDYYTGMVFEIDSPNLGAEKQVGGGGAYRLAEVFGGEAVAQTGFALGLDRLVMSAEAERTIEPPRPLDAYVVPVGDGSRKKAIQILTSLRAAGLGADIDLIGRGPSKNLDYANAIGARFAVILGERELKQGRATLREMANGVQREIAIEALVAAVRPAAFPGHAKVRGPASASPRTPIVRGRSAGPAGSSSRRTATRVLRGPDAPNLRRSRAGPCCSTDRRSGSPSDARGNRGCRTTSPACSPTPGSGHSPGRSP